MYVEIVFATPLKKSFTYKIPSELEKFTKFGVRALAPFAKRALTGFIIGIHQNVDAEYEIKNIYDILDPEPIFDDKSLKFYKWISTYYLCSLGEALRLSLPAGIDVESKRKIIADQDYCASLLKNNKITGTKKDILTYLCQKESSSLQTLQKAVKKKNIYQLLRTLENQGALIIKEEIDDQKVRIKTQKFIRLTKPLAEIYSEIPVIEKRSPKQAALLLYLITTKKKEYNLQEVLKRTSTGLDAAKGLAAKGLCEIYDNEIVRKYVEHYKEEANYFDLTEEQKQVLEEIKESELKSVFKPYLLWGVTGSGKTQVYIELVKIALKSKKTALILVPEISLTPQITSRLISNFKDDVAVIHSRLSLGERYDAWRKILSGEIKVVVGARSALFAPLKNLGLIVVDEEHDSSYKQGDLYPRYNARDLAVVLAKIHNVPVILGSATPSIESMRNAEGNKYQLLKLSKRVDDAKLPYISLVNIKTDKKNPNIDIIFSKALIAKIKDRLEKKEGVILLQNRRGFSTQIFCEECSNVIVCENCSVPLVFHINSNEIHCHYCGFNKKAPEKCPGCNSESLKYFGMGTEKVEDELSYHFPDAAIARIDSDSISKKTSLSNILMKFKKGETDILIGTQMVSKGLDFANVTLVGVISAETTLWMPDFRADERTFQLLTQVAGRAGRAKIEGEVIIQTLDDTNFVLNSVLNYDYEKFYQREITLRKSKQYPPFFHLALIETKDLDNEKAQGAIVEFYKIIYKYRNFVNITDPTTALISRLKGYYRYHLIIKSDKEKDPSGSYLREALNKSLTEFKNRSQNKDVKLIVDIDPQHLL